MKAKLLTIAPMTPLSARLTFASFISLSLAITANALLLQPAAKPGAEKPSAEIVTATSTLAIAPAEAAPVTQSAIAPLAPGSSSAQPENAAASADRVPAAILRELVRKGYARTPGDDAAQEAGRLVIAYEFDSGLPLTGKSSEAILKRLLFDPDRAPRGAFADRAEADHRLVLQVQKTLLELGFFSGTITGRMDEWTQRALTQFQRHRKLAQNGRLTEDTLLDLVAYTGHPIAVAAAANGR